MHKVLYVPQFKFNLISVEKITKDNKCVLYFQPNGCYVQGMMMKKCWPLGRSRSGLYVYEGNQSSTHKESKDSLAQICCSLASTTSTINKAKLWHLRLGPLPMDKVQILFPDIESRTVKSNIICTICPLAKQTRIVYPQSSCKSTRPLELLHIDVWGPFCHMTRHNYTMFISIVDDISRMTWIFLIKEV